MGFHGKDDWESIERRREWKAQEPLRKQVTALEAKIKRLRREIADLKDPHVQEARRIGDL